MTTAIDDSYSKYNKLSCLFKLLFFLLISFFTPFWLCSVLICCSNKSAPAGVTHGFYAYRYDCWLYCEGLISPNLPRTLTANVVWLHQIKIMSIKHVQMKQNAYMTALCNNYSNNECFWFVLSKSRKSNSD